MNATVLVVVLRRREGRLHGREIALSLVRITIASLAMAAFLELAGRWLPWADWRGGSGAVELAVTILAAALVYWGVAALTGAREPAELRAVAARRRR